MPASPPSSVDTARSALPVLSESRARGGKIITTSYEGVSAGQVSAPQSRP